MPPAARTRGGGDGGGKRPPPFRCGPCQVLSVMLTVVWTAVGIGLLLLSQSTSLSIHSCQMYVPGKIGALMAIADAIGEYVARFGWETLLGDAGALLRSEALGLAPYPQLRAAVEGAHLLMVGGARTPEALARARQLGIKLTLVDDASMAGHAVLGGVASFIPVRSFGNTSVREPEAILQAVVDPLQKCKASGGGAGGGGACGLGDYDGVFTLVEDHGPLVSFIAERLGLTASPLNASMVARNKHEVRQAMVRAGLSVPRYALIKAPEGLAAAVEKVGFPAFLKPIYGVQATFAARVGDLGELEATYTRFQREIDEQHHPIYHYGKEMILEQLLGGPEVQLEMMLRGGSVVYHCFSSQYSAHRDTLHFPMILGGEQKEQLLEAATGMIEAVGLKDGVVHVELFLDPVMGAQVIEVNNRLSRGFLAHSFLHQTTFGEKAADYYGSVFALALGKAPAFTHRTASPVNMAVFLDQASVEWWKTDPKDAPNRGWEAEGGCAVFFGASPELAYEAGRAFRDTHLRDFKRSVVDKDDFVIGIVVWGAIVTSARLFFWR